MSAARNLRQNLRSLTGGLPRPFWVLWLGTFVNRSGGFVLPFMTLYLTQVRHFSFAQAGIVVSLYGAGVTIAGPLGGYLADHVGRRFTMMLALGLGGVGMIATGFAERIEVIALAIFGVALVTEMYRPGMQAAVADLVPVGDRVRAFGLMYWVINLGVSVGLTLGGVLAGISYRWLFVGDGITTLLFALVVWFGVPETRPARAPLAEGQRERSQWSGFIAPYRDRPFMLFLGLSFLVALVFMQNASTLPLEMAANGLGTLTYGVIIAVNGVLIVLLQPFMGPFLARRDRSRTLALFSLLVGLGFGINALAHTAPIYALGVVVWTVGEIGVLPVAFSLVADLSPVDLRGRYQGAYGLSFGLAVCAAPVLGTLVLQRLGPVWLWGGCLLLGLVTAAGHLALAPAIRRMRAERLSAS